MSPVRNPTRDCAIDGCGSPEFSRSWCQAHYQRWRKHGDPEAGRRPPSTFPANLLSHLEVMPSGCVEYRGANNNGYGRVRVNGELQIAHRAMWEFMVGPIPEGLHIDHLCMNKACVNPGHLEPVTPAENTRRYFESLQEVA